MSINQDKEATMVTNYKQLQELIKKYGLNANLNEVLNREKNNQLILADDVKRLCVYDEIRQKEIAVITSEEVTTAKGIVIKVSFN